MYHESSFDCIEFVIATACKMLASKNIIIIIIMCENIITMCEKTHCLVLCKYKPLYYNIFQWIKWFKLTIFNINYMRDAYISWKNIIYNTYISYLYITIYL